MRHRSSPMEMRKNSPSSSGDKQFSFPVIIQESDEFEFGWPKSPADHFFYKGKLVPHAFPIHAHNNIWSSRSSSVSSSRDSLMWSRSNSTNSTCSSARTSTSEASSERRVPGRRDRSGVSQCHHQPRRWQLIAAAPELKPARSRKVEGRVVADRKGSREGERKGNKAWFGRRFLTALVSTCKECHAIRT